jgi:uncharacterized protein YlaI
MESLVTCMTCGGRAHRVSTPPPDQPFESGDVVTFICEDCDERIDLVVGDEPDDGE